MKHLLPTTLIILIAGLPFECVLSANKTLQEPTDRQTPQFNINRWNYDQVTADIPIKSVPAASVALARIRIMLHRAKSKTEKQLCAGHWNSRGAMLEQSGPTYLSERNIWSYRSYRKPPPSFECNKVSRSDFFLEMSRYLPEWIFIRPAGQLNGFRQGQIETGPDRPRMLATN